MSTSQTQYLQDLINSQIKVSKGWVEYWTLYSNVGTWQFWVTAILLVGPLVVLYFTLDRSKALRIGFYGFNVHVWFGYIDTFGVQRGLWNYPFKVIPFLPMSVSLDVALVPVAYMLVYQWALNHRRNYYLYVTGLCVIFAFVFKPILTSLDLFQLYRSNYFYLFLGYVVIMLLSKWITDLFVYFENGGSNRVSSGRVGTGGGLFSKAKAK